MWYQGFCGLLLGLLLVATAATAQDKSIAEREQDAIQTYLGLVFQKLESYKRYPRAAERSGLNGRVVLRFTVRCDGEVVAPEVVEVVGHNSFRDAALRTLKRVGQLPPFPSDIQRRELLVEVPISYQLEDRISPGTTEAKEELVGQLLRRAAHGDAEAQFSLGARYHKGRGVLEHYAEAVKWYRKAAEQGHIEAQTALGVMYTHGRGVPQDDVEAVKWFRKAAEQGHAEAQYSLGVMLYVSSEDVPEDYVRAYAWLNLADAQGYGLAVVAKHILREFMTAGQITRAQELSVTLRDTLIKNEPAESPPVPLPAPISPLETLPGVVSYSVQVASFLTPERAGRLIEVLAKKGYRAYVHPFEVPGQPLWYRVKVGKFADRTAAELMLQELRSPETPDAFITRN